MQFFLSGFAFLSNRRINTGPSLYLGEYISGGSAFSLFSCHVGLLSPTKGSDSVEAVQIYSKNHKTRVPSSGEGLYSYHYILYIPLVLSVLAELQFPEVQGNLANGVGCWEM